MSTPTEAELRTTFTTVAPPSTLEHRWREAAVVGYRVRSGVRVRVLVAAFVGALLCTGAVVAGKLSSPAPAAPEKTPSSTEPSPAPRLASPAP
jgi:hypothetical protein